MHNSIFTPKEKHRYSFAARIALLTVVLLFAAIISSCNQGPLDPKMPEKYIGSSWECIEPYAKFEVNDAGFCLGTIVFENVTLPIEVALVRGRHSAKIFSIDAAAHPGRRK